MCNREKWIECRNVTYFDGTKSAIARCTSCGEKRRAETVRTIEDRLREEMGI